MKHGIGSHRSRPPYIPLPARLRPPDEMASIIPHLQTGRASRCGDSAPRSPWFHPPLPAGAVPGCSALHELMTRSFVIMSHASSQGHMPCEIPLISFTSNMVKDPACPVRPQYFRMTDKGHSRSPKGLLVDWRGGRGRHLSLIARGMLRNIFIRGLTAHAAEISQLHRPISTLSRSMRSCARVPAQISLLGPLTT